MSSDRVLSTYYRIAGLHSLAASLIWGVHTLFLVAAGLTLAEVFLVHAATAAAVVVFEVPTGVVADARGRRASVAASAAFLFAGTLLYLLASWSDGGVVLFGLGAVALGIGNTFYSGAAEAWLVDALERAGHRGSLTGVLARGQLITGATSLVGTLAGGFLGALELAVPFMARAVLLVLVAAMALRWMEEPVRAPEPTKAGGWAEMTRLARASVVFGWRRPTVQLLLLVGFVQYGFLTWAYQAWPPWFLDLLGRDTPWVAGVVSALVTLAAMAGNACVDRLARNPDEGRSSGLVAAGLLSAAAVMTGLAGSFIGALAGLLLVSALHGMVGPLVQSALHRELTAEHRATVVSFDSLLRNAGATLGQSGLGFWANGSGIAAGYVLGGLLSTLALPLWARAQMLARRPPSTARLTPRT